MVVDAVVALTSASLSAAEALDPGRSHCRGIGAERAPATLVRGMRQSVEYLGWTFSPRIWATALFAAIAASPMPIVISVIFPG